MPLRFWTSKRIGKHTRVNLDNAGVSVSADVGPVTVNSRGGLGVRLARNISLWFHKGNRPQLVIGGIILVMAGIALGWYFLA